MQKMFEPANLISCTIGIFIIILYCVTFIFIYNLFISGRTIIALIEEDTSNYIELAAPRAVIEKNIGCAVLSGRSRSTIDFRDFRLACCVATVRQSSALWRFSRPHVACRPSSLFINSRR